MLVVINLICGAAALVLALVWGPDFICEAGYLGRAMALLLPIAGTLSLAWAITTINDLGRR